jgi:hypothetical protein
MSVFNIKPKKPYSESGTPSNSTTPYPGSTSSINNSTISFQNQTPAYPAGSPTNGYLTTSQVSANPYASAPSTTSPPSFPPFRPASKNGVQGTIDTSTSFGVQFKKASETLKTHFTISPNAHFIDPTIAQLYNNSMQSWKKTIVYPAIDAYLSGRIAEVEKDVQGVARGSRSGDSKAQSPTPEGNGRSQERT